MTALFGKKKKDELSDIPELPPLDLSKVPPGPPLSGAPQRLQTSENARLTPGTPSPPSSFSPMSTPSPAPPMSQLPPAPAPPVQPTPPPMSFGQAPSPPEKDHVSLMTEDIEKIAEDIIDEKWTKIVGEMNEIKNWKENVAGQISELKDSLSKLDTKISDVQKAILGKVGEYNQNIKDVNVELKAMSKVFEKIMPTFTDNVKKLTTITSKAKTISKTRERPKKK